MATRTKQPEAPAEAARAIATLLDQWAGLMEAQSYTKADEIAQQIRTKTFQFGEPVVSAKAYTSIHRQGVTTKVHIRLRAAI